MNFHVHQQAGRIITFTGFNVYKHLGITVTVRCVAFTFQNKPQKPFRFFSYSQFPYPPPPLSLSLSEATNRTDLFAWKRGYFHFSQATIYTPSFRYPNLKSDSPCQESRRKQGSVGGLLGRRNVFYSLEIVVYLSDTEELTFMGRE